MTTNHAMTAGTDIVAVLACYNRRAQTLQCLSQLRAAAQAAGVPVRVVLVDDASTDGTAAAVREAFPDTVVVPGTGGLFWARGMHLGLSRAMALTPGSHLLWLNDDTLLRPDSLRRLLAESAALQARLGKPVLLVGSTTDPAGALTYGGAASAGGLRRFRYTRVWSADEPLPCDVINGNCVLVPWALAQAVGTIDGAFEHAMGDTDYALRTLAAGYPVYVASGVVATCSANSKAGTFHDKALPLRARWRAMLSRKGLPWRSWLHFTRRHGGLLWPIYFAWPYLRVLLGRSARQ